MAGYQVGSGNYMGGIPSDWSSVKRTPDGGGVNVKTLSGRPEGETVAPKGGMPINISPKPDLDGLARGLKPSPVQEIPPAQPKTGPVQVPDPNYHGEPPQYKPL